MGNESLKLNIVSVPEWDAENELKGVLSGEILEKADEVEAKEMLENTRLDLTPDVDSFELKDYAKTLKRPLEIDVKNNKSYSFYYVEIPLNIIITGKQRMVRLRLEIDLESDGNNPDQVVAYDLFPNNTIKIKEIMNGEFSIDIAKSLKFITAGSPLTDCLGFNLSIPFKWTSKYTTIKTSKRMSNPVEWHVTDESIQEGFTGYLIIRSPINSPVTIKAKLVVEFRKSGLLGKIKNSYIGSDERSYILKGDSK